MKGQLLSVGKLEKRSDRVTIHNDGNTFTFTSVSATCLIPIKINDYGGRFYYVCQHSMSASP